MISKTIGFRGLAYFQTHPNEWTTLKRWDFGEKNNKNPEAGFSGIGGLDLTGVGNCPILGMLDITL